MHHHIGLGLQNHIRLPTFVKHLHPPFLNTALPVRVTRDHDLRLPLQAFCILEELEMPTVHRKSARNMRHFGITADLPRLS